MRKSLEKQLEKILCLIQDVYCSIKDEPVFNGAVEALQLEESSSSYLTFRADYATLSGGHAPAARCSEYHPAWLRAQLAVSHVGGRIRKEGLTVAIFPEITAIFSLLHRTADCPLTKKRPTSSMVYVWSDCEVLDYFCAVIVDHMLKQPLDRASDEFLAALLVFIQPILPFSVAAVKRIVTVIGTRDKFAFKKFFTYIVSAVVVSEIAQVRVNV